ncbi:Uncharacterised protein [Actinobaculum suis]|uniref:Uncharacterized protein n=1 Tax=Actinobaculum suis TaxID=1657 RepID=A0A7Z9CAB8_9ACTO|nr:hypothetical protein [Actinobaculum suis]VDG77330.1 Uncharacterised protein [Actinobaculum suis]
MRIRTIKPEFWTSDDIAALSLEARLLYIGLWNYVDDNGVGVDKEHLIIASLFPKDFYMRPQEVSVRTHGALSELAQRGLIVRYTVENEPYLQIPTWDNHQKINRPSKPRYPQYDAETGALTEDSLSAQEKCTIGTGEQGNRGTGEQIYMHTAPQAAGAPDSQPALSSLPAGDELSSFPAQDEPTQPEPVQGQLPGTQTDRAREYSDEFEEFWAAYPVRKGKARAFEAFKKARKKVTQQTLVEAAGRYADWVQARGIENPKWAQGWLNDERWTDELDTAPARPPSRAAQWLEAGYQLAAEQEAQARGPDPWEIPIGEIDLEGADPWASLPS